MTIQSQNVQTTEPSTKLSEVHFEMPSAQLAEVSFDELQSREENLCICHTTWN